MIFNVGVPAVSMASGVFQNNGTKSIALVLIFFFALDTVFLCSRTSKPRLRTPHSRFGGPFHPESGYGHDIGGTTVDVDGLVQASVREESMLDLWTSETLNVSFGEHHRNARHQVDPER